MSRPQEFKNRPGNVAKVVTFDSTQQQVAVYEASDPNEGKTGDPVKDLEAKLNYITEAVPLADNIVAGSTAGAGSGEFHTYRMHRRREMLRLNAMHAEDKANAAEEAFRKRRAEVDAMEEAKLEKNRSKRAKKKAKVAAAREAKKAERAASKNGRGDGGGGDGGGGDGGDGKEKSGGSSPRDSDQGAGAADFETLD